MRFTKSFLIKSRYVLLEVATFILFNYLLGVLSVLVGGSFLILVAGILLLLKLYLYTTNGLQEWHRGALLNLK